MRRGPKCPVAVPRENAQRLRRDGRAGIPSFIDVRGRGGQGCKGPGRAERHSETTTAPAALAAAHALAVSVYRRSSYLNNSP